MIGLLKKEIKELVSFFARNYAGLVVAGMATLVLALDKYHPISPVWLGDIVYFAAIPVAAIVLLLRKNPLDFGLSLGDRRTWLLHVSVFVIIGLPILFWASHNASLVSFYTRSDFNAFTYTLEEVAMLISWEFLFRGFLLFGLRDKLKEHAILLQMVPFVLMHLPKPELETLSTIPMGIYFGYVAYRGKSFWPAFIIHMFINVSFVVMVNWL